MQTLPPSLPSLLTVLLILEVLVVKRVHFLPLPQARVLLHVGRRRRRPFI